MDARETMTAPLDGVRVLDFSIMLAGPYCARLLADVGADVIKIEPPEGDDMRLRAPLREGQSTYFGQLNAGKRSLALDLKSEEAIKLVHGLVADADILVENFRPGVMDRLGLGYEALRVINPRLIYCAVSGFGQNGPERGTAAFDGKLQAMSGIMSITGHEDKGPTRAGFALCDTIGAMTAAFAVASALSQG